MRYTESSIDTALQVLIPDTMQVNSQLTYKMPRVTVLGWAAIAWFTKQQMQMSDFNPTWNERLSLHVVAEALHDLETLGHIVYGTRDVQDDFNSPKRKDTDSATYLKTI